MIAGLPQSPSLYNPLQNEAQRLERRNEVLDAMAEDFISEAEPRREGRGDQAQALRPLQRDP